MSTTVNRRAVAKGVAWTVPAVTIAYAAPAVAASPQDVTVTKSGTGPITNGVLPFSICAIGADIASGSTFTLSGVTGVAVDSPFSISGSTITLNGTIQAGKCETLTVRMSGKVNGDVSVKTGTINGNSNQNEGNDSASYSCKNGGGANGSCS